MKILHSYKIFGPDSDGGIPSTIRALGQLTDGEVENAVLAADGKEKRYVVDGVSVETVQSFGTLFSTPLAVTFPFRLLRRAGSFDIVVHHAPFPIADLAMSWLPKRVALIVYWHADIFGHPFLGRLLAPIILRTLHRADRIIISDVQNIATSKMLSHFIDKCTVVPFGTDVPYWSTCSIEEQNLSVTLRNRYPRMVLVVARLVSYKGISILLQAVKEIDCQVVLIGEGPLRQKLQEQAAEFGVSNKVTFAGRLSTSEVKAYMHAAAVLAFPSISSAEAFGIVQIEAMAAGLPIVNTALNTGVPRVARHDREALTVPPNDPSALAAALRRILDDPSLADRLGRAGQERARAEYSQEKYLSRMEVVYREVLERKRASNAINPNADKGHKF